MLRTDAAPPTFGSGWRTPLATYLLVLGVLSALTLATPGHSPPLLGMAWGGFLAALAVAGLKADGISARTVLPSVRSVPPVLAVVVAFWVLYNVVAYGLALGGVPGVEATWSRVVAHPLPYLAALLSSLLFTAVPEELVFRTYLQQKCIALVGGDTRRAVAVGVSIVAVLFAFFHLPRWFFASGHGVGTALAVRLLGLTLAGLAYGGVYALTGNLWLVALFHATMNYRPVLVTVQLPTDLHLVAGVVEYAAILSVVYVTVRVTDPDGDVLRRPRGELAS